MAIDLDAHPSASEPSSRRPGLADLTVVRPMAIVAILAVLAAGGSAAPLPGLRHVLAAESTSGEFALAPDALFTADFGAAPGRQATVRRHSLGDASPPWSAELPQTVGSLEIVRAARVLAVWPAQVLMTTSVDQVRTTFLDSGTGEILWSTTSDGVLCLAETSALMTGGGGDSAVLRRADLRTGETLWSRELRSASYLDVGDPSAGPCHSIVTVDQRGRATVVDFADGDVLATADLGVAPARDDTATYAAVGGHLYLSRRDNGRASLTAYRQSDLRPLWRTSVATRDRPIWCGPGHLCVSTAAGLTVLDSDTGAVRWSDSRWRTGTGTVAMGIPGPARIAVTDDRPEAGSALLDPATGATLSVLGTSTFVGAKLLRADRDQPGRTWVQVTGTHHEVRTLGAVDSIASDRCAATADHLACPTSSGRINVWRLPD